jgi:hypothetical protein
MSQKQESNPSSTSSPAPPSSTPQEKQNAAEPEQASDLPETGQSKGEKEQLSSVVWGQRNKLTADQPITYDLTTSTFTIELIENGVIRVNEVETDEPPFLASVAKGEGFIRMGHIRDELPLIVRFPRPVLTLPGSTFQCYSTYPTRPALYYETPDGTTMKLLELPGLDRKKSTYGSLTDAIVCHLHHGEHATHPTDLPDDPRTGIVHFTLKNKSPDPQEVSILLLNPGRIDFYSKDERLCLGKVQLDILTEEQAEVNYRSSPSLSGAELVDRHKDEETHSRALSMLRSLIGDTTMSGGY